MDWNSSSITGVNLGVLRELLRYISSQHCDSCNNMDYFRYLGAKLWGILGQTAPQKVPQAAIPVPLGATHTFFTEITMSMNHLKIRHLLIWLFTKGINSILVNLFTWIRK
ncbi:MAG: hypothetical protein SNJ29_09890 [Rikenellaceae bacterium]